VIAVDTNVLVYAHRTDSPHHARALASLTALATGSAPWGLPYPCVHEFLSIVTHPRIYDPPSELALALQAVRSLAELPGCVLLHETADHLELLEGLLERSGVGGPKVHDARVAAICLGHGVRDLWSADRDFSYFPDLRTSNPLVAGR
jgi:toxin-antitoxin system PIN domain toxin